MVMVKSTLLDLRLARKKRRAGPVVRSRPRRERGLAVVSLTVMIGSGADVLHGGADGEAGQDDGAGVERCARKLLTPVLL
jgi:hypothetical protein